MSMHRSVARCGLVLLSLALGACDNSGAMPDARIGGPDARAGVSTDYSIPSDVDGEAIAFTVHEPTRFVPGATYPLIMEGHGYGGSRVTAADRPAAGDAGTVGRLLDAGYGVISFDQRGHGESGGQIRILDPDFEGKDLLQALDYAEANLPWLAYRNDNLVLGAIGGSYGGGYQHLVYAIDPKHRLDAIAPEITWNDLRYSLYQGSVFKTFWAALLSAAGNGTPGGQDPEVNEGLAQGYQNALEQDKLDLLYRNSLVSHCEGNNTSTAGGALTPIDALYWQSAGDTLFNLNDAVHNFQCVSALGGDVRLLVKTGGHDSLAGGGSGETCGSLDKVQSIVDWYDEKLKGIPGKASYIPQNCFHLGVGGTDGAVTDGLPAPTLTVPDLAATLVAQDGSAQVQSLLLATAGPDGAIIAGIPTAQVSVTDPSGLAAGDPIVFIGLAKRAAGTTTDTLLMANEVAPVRGWGDFDRELVGVSARLAAGEELRVLVYAAFQPRYPGAGSDAPTPVGVTMTVNVPMLPGTLPAPPSNTN
jgi:ABC-2 type transport system ATP-binding protein